MLGLQPGIREKLAECDRVVYTVGFERRKLPETPQLGELEYNPNNGILAPGLFGLGIAFPEYAQDPYGYGQYRVGLQKFMDYLNAVLPLWMLYGHLTLVSGRSTQHHRRMAATPVHRAEPGVETQPRRQDPDPDHLVGGDRIRPIAAGNPLRSKRTRNAWAAPH